MEVRSFLGLAGYYRKFIKDFSKIAAPLTRLTQKNVKFVWIDKCEEHFQMLKDKLTWAPVLTLPSKSEGYMVYCDVSRVGLGCILMRYGRLVAYASCQLKKHEHNYSTLIIKAWNISFKREIWIPDKENG